MDRLFCSPAANAAPAWRLFLATLLIGVNMMSSGCGSDSGPNMPDDLASRDLAVARDTATSADLTTPVDLTTPANDADQPDLMETPDLALLPDLTPEADLATPADLAVAPTCNDGVKNANETDVDCGGDKCPKCSDGKGCAKNSDCASLCVNGQCVAPPDPCASVKCPQGFECKVEMGLAVCNPIPQPDLGGTSDDAGPTADLAEAPKPDLAALPDLALPPDLTPLADLAAPPAPTCLDKQKNANETDVDCGGDKCPKCSDGKVCAGNGDCNSGSCQNGACAAPSCSDSVKNANETDVDCGGANCAKCGEGKGCVGPNDCLTGVCKNGKCQGTCSDMVKNNAETDVDCGGGTCNGCADGKACILGTDCVSQACLNNKCIAPTCADGIKNGAETDVDCGGAKCNKCADLKDCKVNSDCTSGVCSGNQCIAASCVDKVKNAKETDVDCGGPNCPNCLDGKACTLASDCASGVCKLGKCAAPSCSDKAKNGTETDVDCGGLCPKCGSGKGCSNQGDCQSNICKLNVCLAPACNDGVKNGTETDTDCGGASQDWNTYGEITCSRCADHLLCTWNGDCKSWYCLGGRCSTPTCVDGVQGGNGGETDTDCGLVCPNGCELNRWCHLDEDCKSGFCFHENPNWWFGKCAVKPACMNQQQVCNLACVDTATDPNNCGACNNKCAVANGTAGCAAGKCTVAKCNAGWGNCDQQVGNGCEADLTKDKANCGACGASCVNGKESCVASACACLAPATVKPLARWQIFGAVGTMVNLKWPDGTVQQWPNGSWESKGLGNPVTWCPGVTGAAFNAQNIDDQLWQLDQKRKPGTLLCDSLTVVVPSNQIYEKGFTPEDAGCVGVCSPQGFHNWRCQ